MVTDATANPDASGSAPAEQPPAESSPSPAESQGGNGAGIEAFKTWLGSIQKPEEIEAVLSLVPKDAREGTSFFKDALERGRHSGRQSVIHDLELQKRDIEQHEQGRQRLEEIQRSLSSEDELDPATRKRHASTLLEAARDVRDHELREEALKVFKGATDFDGLSDEHFDRLARVSGRRYDTWLREYVEVHGEVREQKGYERGVEEARRKFEGERKLEASLSGNREGAAPPTGGGTPSAGMTWETFSVLPIEEKAKFSDAERGRIYQEHLQRLRGR